VAADAVEDGDAERVADEGGQAEGQGRDDQPLSGRPGREGRDILGEQRDADQDEEGRGVHGHPVAAQLRGEEKGIYAWVSAERVRDQDGPAGRGGEESQAEAEPPRLPARSPTRQEEGGPGQTERDRRGGVHRRAARRDGLQDGGVDRPAQQGRPAREHRDRRSCRGEVGNPLSTSRPRSRMRGPRHHALPVCGRMAAGASARR
jgi:hypothetical protein